MNSKIKKYKILAIIYLSASVISGSMAVYKAIPTVVANNGDSIDQMMTLLEDGVTEDISFTEQTIDTSNVLSTDTNLEEGIEVNPNADDLFTWNEDSKETVPNFVKSINEPNANDVVNIEPEILEKLESEGTLNKSYSISDITNYKLSVEYTASALLVPKADVYDFYNAIKQTNDFNVTYDNTQNIIFVEILRNTSTDGFHMLTQNSTAYTDNTSTFNIENNMLYASAGYNGCLLTLTDNIPIVYYNSPYIEPILNHDIRARINEIKDANKPEVKEEELDSIEPDEFELHSDISDFLPTDNTFTDIDNGNFFSDAINDLSPIVPSGSGAIAGSTSNSTSTSVDDTLDQIRADLEKRKEQNKQGNNVWGLAEKDTTVLKENISDGSDIVPSKGTTLNVVDTVGNKIDLDKKTRETKPSSLNTGTKIQIATQEIDTSLPISTYICLLFTVLSLLMYTRSLNLFKKEYRRYLETRGLRTTTVTADDIEDINDSIDTDQEELLDAEILLDDN